MSNPFKYEIDERHLRLRLKENELAFHEEAWQKFESFAASHNSLGAEIGVQRFRMPLNRNVVLPVVFASVITLFSLLLFNFINIKDSSKESAETTQNESLPPEEPVRQTIPAVVPAPEPKEEAETAAIPAETKEVKTDEPKQEPTPSEENTERKALAQEPSGKKDTDVRPDSNSSLSNLIESAPSVKKRRRRAEPIVTEPTVEEADQAPPPAENPL